MSALGEQITKNPVTASTGTKAPAKAKSETAKKKKRKIRKKRQETSHVFSSVYWPYTRDNLCEVLADGVTLSLKMKRQEALDIIHKQFPNDILHDHSFDQTLKYYKVEQPHNQPTKKESKTTTGPQPEEIAQLQELLTKNEKRVLALEKTVAELQQQVSDHAGVIYGVIPRVLENFLTSMQTREDSRRLSLIEFARLAKAGGCQVEDIIKTLQEEPPVVYVGLEQPLKQLMTPQAAKRFQKTIQRATDKQKELLFTDDEAAGSQQAPSEV